MQQPSSSGLLSFPDDCSKLKPTTGSLGHGTRRNSVMAPRETSADRPCNPSFKRCSHPQHGGGVSRKQGMDGRVR
ncbi:hypothetical protein CGRA01v4_02987 [Colletotrichum graminicola]|nr:hypothetical protein CGRA01v4_02987 [Colletotrichum graminicola]